MIRRKQGGFARLNSLTQVLAGAGTAGLGAINGINNMSMPFFNVPMTVILMAAGGALASVGYGEPIKDRKILYKMVIANTFLATVFTALFPAVLGWSWSSPKIEPVLAAAIAAGLRWIMPAIIVLIPELLRKIFKLPPASATRKIRIAPHL